MVAKCPSSLWTVLTVGIGRHDSPIAFIGGPGGRSNYRYSGSRRFLPLPTVPLAFVKALKNAAGDGVSVNDIMFSSTAGLLRRYSELVEDRMLQRSGDNCCDRFTNYALMPVAMMRPAAERADPANALRNHWCFVPAELPVRVADPKERLALVRGNMKALKSSPTAHLQMGVQDNCLSCCAVAVPRKLAFDAMSRATVIFSNVPGPQEPVSLGPRRINGLQMVFPNLIPQVGILSLNGQVFMNFVLDPKEVKQADRLPQLYIDELTDLAAALQVPLPEGPPFNG